MRLYYLQEREKEPLTLRGGTQLCPLGVDKGGLFLQGARKILVCSDAKSLKGLLHQDLDKIENERKQKMVEEMLQYRSEVRYVPGPKIEFADHGSRYPISHGQHKWFESQPGELAICVRAIRSYIP